VPDGIRELTQMMQNGEHDSSGLAFISGRSSGIQPAQLTRYPHETQQTQQTQ